MIGFLLDYLRKSTGQQIADNRSTHSHSQSGSASVVIDDGKWREEFEELLSKSEGNPRILVDFARHGFPSNLRGWVWCRILRTKEVPLYLQDFDKELLRVFGTLDPVHFQAPCFGNQLDFDRIKLSANKKTTIKKLLCIVGDAHPHLEYTPIVPAVVAVLVKFLEPNDVLACLSAMIEGHSIPASKRQDWAYFPIHRRDYLVFERVFEDLLSIAAPKVSKHIRKVQLKNADFAPHWVKILFGLFIGILPREIVVRIFDCFIVEGYKILLRFSIAHVIIRQGELLAAENPDDINKALIDVVPYSQELLELYFKTAMRVKFDRSIIQRYRNRRRKHSIGDYDQEDKLFIFQRPLPFLKKPSSFMQDQDWASLWSWVPARFRLLDLDLSFTTAEHGKHLSTLLDSCRQQEPVLILIETVSGKFLGAYVSKALTSENGPTFYGSGESFLFSLRPNAVKYEWDIHSNNNSFICVTDSFMAMGAGSDFGLWIDKFLSNLTSAPSITFRNDSLIDMSIADDMEIYCLEVFRFV